MAQTGSFLLFLLLRYLHPLTSIGDAGDSVEQFKRPFRRERLKAKKTVRQLPVVALGELLSCRVPHQLKLPCEASASQRFPHTHSAPTMAGGQKGSTSRSKGRAQTDEAKHTPKMQDAPMHWIIKWSLVIAALAIVIKLVFSFLFRDQVNVPFGPPLPTNLVQGKWGSMRPGVYFGTKSINPPKKSLVTGLMWFRNRIEGRSLPIRHWCNQHDRLDSYTWTKHDFHTFGIQEISDGTLKIRTSLLMQHDSWSAKISAWTLADEKKKQSQSKPQVYSFIYYTTTEDVESEVSMTLQPGIDSPIEADRPFIVKGFAQSNYSVSMKVTKGVENVLYKTFIGEVVRPPLVHLKEAVLSNLQLVHSDKDEETAYIVLHNKGIPEDVNFYAHQIIFEDSIELQIDYVQASGMAMDAAQLEERLIEKSIDFSDRFEHIFGLKAKGYTEKQIAMAESMLSNMLGAIGYFYGSSKVSSARDPENVKLYGPLQLFTAVPSRSFFPRGFFWDEGFHNLLISRFDSKLGTSIIKSWFNLMNAEGWIPREVILGSEAEARVPSEFVVQKNTNANPPTFFLSLESLIQHNAIHDDELRALFPRLLQWYDWFTQSQSGPREGTYRWRGRDPKATHELNAKTLTSGLDDYPRASTPTEDEYHVDLRCWVTLATRVMAEIARRVGDASAYQLKEKAASLMDNSLLDELHWSDEHMMYCDQGLHSSSVKLVKEHPDKPPVRRELKPSKFTCVPEYGYVSLFPFLLQIIEPSNPRLKTIIESMNLKSHLWTPFGLRSLSTHSPYYNQYNTAEDGPYWRGAIWIQINYLALRSLHHYANTPGPYSEDARQLYGSLRSAIVNNVLAQFEKTGYVWEQYNDTDGKGHGSHPFTGWSALTVLAMGELY